MAETEKNTILAAPLAIDVPAVIGALRVLHPIEFADGRRVITAVIGLEQFEALLAAAERGALLPVN